MRECLVASSCWQKQAKKQGIPCLYHPQAEPIPKELLEEWATAQPCEELFLPKRNPFVPTNFDIIEAEHAEAPKVPVDPAPP